jgi:colanic acid/amylovoran biosynthesis protein
MIVEIRGTGTHNKGAELMFQVVLERLTAANPDIVFAVERWFGSYEERARYGLHTFLPTRSGKRSRIVSSLMSKSFRQTYGLVSQSDIDAVIDASGFAFGDQWGMENVRQLAVKAKRWKRRGIPTVFLPQAWGPFTTPRIKDYAKKAVDNLDLVFAREQTSLNHLRGAGATGSHVHKSNDFTNLAEAYVPETLELPDQFACIVPNFRMLDKADAQQSQSYVDFLAQSIRTLRERGIVPVYIFHDRKNDQIVADRVQAKLKYEVATLAFECPRVLKGILGKATLVVGSRFHALVAALSQGVPSIATSWSHKYEELFSEYGVSELVVDPADRSALNESLARLTDPDERVGITQLLLQKAEGFKQQSEEMFRMTLATLKLDRATD